MLKKYFFNLKNKKIWVAGHNGMVGRAIVKKLIQKKLNVLTVDKKNLDLTNQNKTFKWIQKNSPHVIFLAAAKVGGIKANNLNQTDFLYKIVELPNHLVVDYKQAIFSSLAKTRSDY